MSLSQEPLTRAVRALVLTCAFGSIAGADEIPVSAPAQGAAEQTPDPKAPKEKEGKMEKAKDAAAPEGWHREGFEYKNGKNKIGLAGYVQGDFRHYDWAVQGDETGDLQAPTHELRRLRIGVEGEFGKASFEVTVDPSTGAADEHLKDGTVGYAFSKHFKLLAGHFKIPFSQEFLTSAGKTDFVDRSMLGSRIVPDREWGGKLFGEAGRFEYAVGAFAGDGSSSPESAGTTGAVRLTFKVMKGFSFSGSFTQGKVEPDPRVGATEPEAKGPSGRTATGFTYFNRPHVNGTRRRLGGDAIFTKGAFRFQAEYLEYRDQRKSQGSTGQDIPDVLGRGWSAQAGYLIVGERKSSTIAPTHSVFSGGFGALEIVARAEALNFDDAGDSSGFAGYGNRARNIAPSNASALQVGLNYMPTNFMKLQGSAIWESYNDPLIAPEPGKTGKYVSLLGRIMFLIP